LAITASSGLTTVLDFRAQHSANLLPGGQLALFDNRWNVSGTSRMLTLELDEVAGTADVVEVYDLGIDCPQHGGSFALEGGNRLVTCGTTPNKAVYEFAPGGTAPVFEMTVDCPDWAGLMNRAMPVEWNQALPGGVGG
jgi:hypothetical protein